MCILPSPHTATTAADAPTSPLAHALDSAQRQQVARAALAGRSITDLAQQHHVSRKFVYQQLHHAHEALDHAFAPPAAPSPEPPLFALTVTRSWLEQLVLALLLIGHCSLRGAYELLRDLFDYPLSVGTLHQLVHQAIARAAVHNARQDLTAVGCVALDEIFQTRRPVLAVVDVASTYCCLLSQEAQRDAETWAVRLLELQQQGFDPHAAIADGGTGLRAGLALALPTVPCRADHFHAERDLGQVVRFLENRAYAALAAGVQHSRPRRGGDDPQQRARREQALREQDQAVALADDVALLADWLRDDVFAVAGPGLPERAQLFDFVLSELQARVACCPHRLGPVCRTLRSHKQQLLAFAADLDRDLQSLAAYARVPETEVRELLAVQALAPTSVARWQRETALRRRLGTRYAALAELVETLRGGVVRASSVVENLNSRLRNYFFLRREIGGGYLELLRFFLNHRRFLRSEHPERVDRSPAELLTGQAQPHWLELLGYTRFRRAV
jgi:hypothetical protein